MPLQVTDIDVLRDYLRGVMSRADHHAQDVNEVALSVAGGVVWRKDDDPLEVMSSRTREGGMANVIWFKVSQRRYALSYNHETGEIELRKNSIKGSVIASFSNSMTNAQVREVFDRL